MNSVMSAARALLGAGNRETMGRHYGLTIQQLPADALTVLGFHSAGHAMSDDYRFEVEALGESGLDADSVMGSEVTLRMLWSGEKRPLHGVVCDFYEHGRSPDGALYTVVIGSPLAPLKEGNHTRNFLNRTVEEIVTEVLERAEVPAASYEFDLQESYAPRELVVQYEESDWAFIRRILARDGIFFAFEQEERRAKVVFCDNAASLSERLGTVHLPYVPEGGQARTSEGVLSVSRVTRLTTNSVALKEYNERTPDERLYVETSNRTAIPGVGTDYRYGEHYLDQAEGERLAQFRQEALDCRRSVMRMESDCRGLAPGTRLLLSGHPEMGLNGEWLVLEVTHHGDERALSHVPGNPEQMRYHNELEVIQASLPYRSAQLPRPRLTGTLPAQVEGDGGDYAFVDGEGRYRIRLPYDLSDTPEAEASPPVRLLQPYGGRDHGMHFPLHAGTQVLVTWVNGDPDRPVILGALPNGEQPATVTAANVTQNILRTWGGNELLMEDREGEEKVELFTRERKNILSLDATADANLVRLASEEGDLELHAGKSMLLECGESQTTEVGADHEVTVQGTQRLMTQEGDIEYQAAQDFNLRAEEAVRISAESENLELRAEGELVMQSGDTMSLEVTEGDGRFLVEEGNFELEAAGAITFLGKGGGPIQIGQGDGAIEISEDGDLVLDGPTVKITGDEIAVSGQDVGNN